MWKRIDDTTNRMKVPGGWIVSTFVAVGHSCSIHSVFVPDPQHTWEWEPDKPERTR